MSPTKNFHLTDAQRQLLRTKATSPISWDTGAFYPQPHYDLLSYQNFNSVGRPLLTKAEATEVLVDNLTPVRPLSKREQSALSRIETAWRDPEWDASLVIKAMADLDSAFFDGWLKGNVVIVWAGEEDIVKKGCKGGKGPETGNFLGLCQPLLEGGEQRCKVWLNADTIFDRPDPRVHMWRTVLHELVHAYALISSDRDFFIDYHVALSNPFHDDQFNYLLDMVDRRSMKHLQMPAKPEGEGHTICLNCNPRPLMYGDNAFGMDEQGEMLRGQKMDPKWDRGVD